MWRSLPRHLWENVWLRSLVLLLSAECVCRLAIALFSPPSPDLYAWDTATGWRLKPGFEGVAYHAPITVNPLGWRDRERTHEKRPGTKRVICLGDSRTFGFGVSVKATFPWRLEQQSKDAESQPWEVWNAGVPGFTAYQGARVLETLLEKADPDVMVVSFGFNERRYVVLPAWADGPEYFERFATGSVWRERICTAGVGRVLVNAAQSIQRYNLTRKPPPVTDLIPRVDLHGYVRALGDIVTQCQTKGVPVIFLLLCDSPLLRGDVERAVDGVLRGDMEDAIAVFSRGTVGFQYGKSMLCMIELVRLSDRLNKPLITQEQERSYPYSASTHGAEPVRHDRDYRRAAAALASELGVPVVDMTQRFDRMPDIFLDQCHFDARGHAAIADELAVAIARISDTAR